MKILVPTDFSPQAEAATELAANLARVVQGEVILHHAYSPLVDWTTVPMSEETKFPEVKSKVNRARARLHEVAGHYPDVAVSTQLSFYETIEEVLGDVHLEDIDLIVTGTHGRKDLSNVIMGSDTQRIIRLAECPVMVVRQPVAFPFEDILFVSDCREDVCLQLGQLLDLGKKMNARIHLGYVNTPVEFRNTEEVEAKMDLMDRAFPEYRFFRHIYNHVRIDEGIMKLAARVQAGALALVTHGRKGWNRFFYQSLTEKIALESEIPVISFHLHQDAAR